LILTFKIKKEGKFLVNLLNSSQNLTVLTPTLPKTVPKGGAGSAFVIVYKQFYLLELLNILILL
jgi:hypothetical protein